MYVCKEHLEIAMDDILAQEELPVIHAVNEAHICVYCEQQAQYEIVAQAVRVEY